MSTLMRELELEREVELRRNNGSPCLPAVALHLPFVYYRWTA